jgi:hypothetical protein
MTIFPVGTISDSYALLTITGVAATALALFAIAALH